MRPVLLIAIVLAVAAIPALAADSMARKAVVATGAVVELAPSAKTAKQWAAERPGFATLRPGKTR